MIIYVEGNISAGKSTFGKILCDYLNENGYNSEFINEPLDVWLNVSGINVLQLFYEDTKRWGFMFQVLALLSMTENESKAEEYSKIGKIVIIERSVRDTLEIFSKLMLENNLLQDFEFDILQKLYDKLTKEIKKDKFIIYLKTEPEICFQRLCSRNRVEEIGYVHLDYLKRLHNIHEIIFTGNNSIFTKVIKVDQKPFNNIQGVNIISSLNVDLLREIKDYQCGV